MLLEEVCDIVDTVLVGDPHPLFQCVVFLYLVTSIDWQLLGGCLLCDHVLLEALGSLFEGLLLVELVEDID